MTNPKKSSRTLWIGGSSSLARTYANKFGEDGLLLSGLEEHPPDWIANAENYVPCNLTTLNREKAKELFFDKQNIETIIIGVRPILFAARVDTGANDRMLRGLSALLEEAAESAGNLRYVLHVSSVAAVDHLRAQRFIKEENNDCSVPTLSDLRAPYDVFKRQSELLVERICRKAGVAFSHLRLSAIFSDDPDCIQCRAMDLQSRIGCYIPWPIDCNSACNVSEAIRAMIVRANNTDESTINDSKPAPPLQPVYYYTRPLMLSRPVPYGYYLENFRKAHGIEHSSIWIPVWIVTFFTAFVHWLASWNHHMFVELPFLDAVDYLLQVASREHSFDCSLFARDFSGLEEESILQCFNRRRRFLLESHTTKPKQS